MKCTRQSGSRVAAFLMALKCSTTLLVEASLAKSEVDSRSFVSSLRVASLTGSSVQVLSFEASGGQRQVSAAHFDATTSGLGQLQYDRLARARQGHPVTHRAMGHQSMTGVTWARIVPMRSKSKISAARIIRPLFIEASPIAKPSTAFLRSDSGRRARVYRVSSAF